MSSTRHSASQDNQLLLLRLSFPGTLKLLLQLMLHAAVVELTKGVKPHAAGECYDERSREFSIENQENQDHWAI